MSTVASLPFLFFTLPAGALADIVDRKKLLLLMNLWLAIAAAALAVLSWLHLLSTQVVLVAVFLIGVGFAFESPAWTSIIPEIVSTSELPSAATLGGLQLRIFRDLRTGPRGILATLHRSELGICGERRLLFGGDLRDFPMETNSAAIQARFGKLLRFIRQGDPVRSLRTRNSDRTRTECAVCTVHLGHSSANAGHRAEGVTS